MISTLKSGLIVVPVKASPLSTEGPIHQIALKWPHAYQAYRESQQAIMGGVVMTRAMIHLSVCFIICINEHDELIPGALFTGIAQVKYDLMRHVVDSIHIMDHGTKYMPKLRQLGYFTPVHIHPAVEEPVAA